MPGITIDVEIGAFTESMNDLERTQIPFATSRTVNGLALLIQDAIRTGLRERFTVRQDYQVRYGIKIPRFAKKEDDPIQAEVVIPPEFDHWWKFQTGETKRPHGGLNLAITSSAAFPQRVAPRGQRPRDLALGDDGKGADRTFVIDSGATPGIYQRTGKGKRDIRLLFHFARSAPTPVFDFYAIAERVVQTRLQAVFAHEMTNAIATAKD